MSLRTQQVASLLVHRVSEIIARELEPPDGCLITVMRAEVTPDLKFAKIFVSILPENKTDSALTMLQRNKKTIQHLVNRTSTMKFSPTISWALDVTTRKYAAIDDALKREK